MYALELKDTMTDETMTVTMTHYYDTIDLVATLFENELNALLFVEAKFQLRVIDDVFGCLAYANGDGKFGGLIWEPDEELEDGSWNWDIPRSWDENEEKRA